MIHTLLTIVLSTASLEPLTARMESMEYLTGQFVQTDYYALTMDSQESSGTLHLAHPNLFLLEYSDIPGRSSGCTGDTVFTVDPEFMEILVYTGTPSGFLHILSLPDSCSCTAETIETPDSVTVTLTGEFDGGLNTITTRYSREDSLPGYMRTVDLNGNSTSWRLTELMTLPETPDIFRLPAMEGYSVVDAGSI